MKVLKKYAWLLLLMITILACDPVTDKGTFGYDLSFLKKHKELLVLKENEGQSQIIIVPDYQGRVMTSTAQGPKGKSYGWLNYELIASNEMQKQINAFGGEDRFWLGPEGGQYSIFFQKGTEFSVANWATPAPIDTEPFQLIEQSDTAAVFTKEMKLTNYQAYEFSIRVDRSVSIMSQETIKKNLGFSFDDEISVVGYSSENTLTNTGTSNWSKKTGLLSIWIMGMFTPSPQTTVIIPYKDSLILNTAYFGEIGSDRLKVTANAILFKADGKYRCKIGVLPQNASPVLGSYDAQNNVLNIVQYSLGTDTAYVNSLWKYQENPYGGDVVNAYNDGPMEDGTQLGPFYELESSSPARELKVQESLRHVHSTYHFEGSKAQLDTIARQVLRIGLDELSFLYKNDK